MSPAVLMQQIILLFAENIAAISEEGGF